MLADVSYYSSGVSSRYSWKNGAVRDETTEDNHHAEAYFSGVKHC